MVVAGMWDELCLCRAGISCAPAVGRRLWEFLQSCNDWTGVREAGTQIKTRDTALFLHSLLVTQSARLVLQTKRNTCSKLC